MKANIKNDQYLVDDLALTEPHFDDEQTVLSARRVIPLSQIKERELQGKHRTFGLAIFVSLLLGISATVIYKQRQQQAAEVIKAAEPATTPTISPENFPSAGIGTLSESSSPSPVPTGEVLNSTAERDTLSAKAPSRKPVRVARVAKRANHQLQPEVPSEARDRRVRRDGAWRIREIFEGSRRP